MAPTSRRRDLPVPEPNQRPQHARQQPRSLPLAELHGSCAREREIERARVALYVSMKCERVARLAYGASRASPLHSSRSRAEPGPLASAARVALAK